MRFLVVDDSSTMRTTNAAKDDIVEALRAGVNNYIVKPFTPDTFKEKIEAVTAE
jgi:two-component system chemotaxis response regulator CheY